MHKGMERIKDLGPILAVLLASMASVPARSADMGDVGNARHPRIVLPAERHVIEKVRLPYGDTFRINGTYFTARSQACLGWAAGEQIRLVSGDWHGRCVAAVFYNMTRRRTCEMWCD